MPIIQTSSAEFYYEQHGEGHPLILISGYTCDHTIWYPMLKFLSSHFQVTIFDNRACGQTEDSKHDLTIELMATDVMTIANALKLKTPHIVGHSMGGAIAQTIGARFHDQIASLGVISSSSKWRIPTLLALKSILKLREKGIDLSTLLEVTSPWIYSEAFLSDKNRIRDLKRNMKESPFPQSLENQKRQYKALEHFDGRKQLSTITSKSIILYAKEDLLALPNEALALSNGIKNSKIVEFANSAHGVILEEPEAVSKVLMQFLSK
jgi:3-oxoadipate enol-lactonase